MVTERYVDLNQPLTVAWVVPKWQLLVALVGWLLLS